MERLVQHWERMLRAMVEGEQKRVWEMGDVNGSRAV